MAKLHSALTNAELHNPKGITAESTASILALNQSTSVITASADFVPSSTQTYDLGSTSHVWQEIYVATSSINFVNPAGTVVHQIKSTDSGIVFTSGSTGIVSNVSGSILSGSALHIQGNAKVTGDLTLGGQITLGDADSDDIVFEAEVSSSLIPNNDNAFDLGKSSQQWKDIYVNGIGYIDQLGTDGDPVSAYINAGEIDGVTLGAETAVGAITSTGTITGSAVYGTLLGQNTTTGVKTITIEANSTINQDVSTDANATLGTLGVGNVTSTGIVSGSSVYGTTIGQNRTDGLKTITIEANSIINQDLSTDADATLGTLGVGNVSSTGTVSGSVVYGTTIGQNTTGGLKTITIESNSTVNQDLTTDAAVTFATVDTGQGANELYDMNQNVLTTSSPTFAGITVSGGGLVLTGAATDVDLIDNNASALSFDASGKTGILEIITTDNSEKVKMSNDLEVVGDISGSMTSTGSFSRVTADNGAFIIDNAKLSGSSVTTGSFGAVVMSEVIGNWTNAGNTVADGGTVTTIDINGGTIDGVGNVNSTGTITGSAVYGTTIGQNRTDGLKTITIEANSTVNQDLTTDASPTFAGLTSTGDITLTGQATDVDLIDNNSSAVSFDASGKTGILEVVTTNAAEKVAMSAGLTIEGFVTASGGISGSTAHFNEIKHNTATGLHQLTLNEDLTVSDGTNVVLAAAGQANTFTMNESLTVGDGNSGTLTYSGASKTLTVEDSATVDQDLTKDANVQFASATLTGTLTAQEIIVSSSVSYITASFASGSNILGDTSDDTHKVTGSLQVSGAADVLGNLTVATDSAFTLGASGTQWSNVYTDNLTLDGQGRIDLDDDLDTSIRASADDVITIEAAGADQVAFTDGTIEPVTSDDIALGTTSKMFSDLFVGSGGVINFNNGNMTVTHVAGRLDIDGGELRNDGLISGSSALWIGGGSSYMSSSAGSLKLTGNIVGVGNITSTGTITGSAVYGTTIGQNRVDGVKTLTIEANSTVNQDLSSDASPTFAGADFSDGNIANVGDIDADSISIADAASGLNINFGGNTTKNKITLGHNLADALSFISGSTKQITFITTAGSTQLDVNVNSTFNGTTIADLGTVTTADINGGTIDGATIATSDVTVGSGKTLNVSAGTLTTSTAQKLAIVQGVGGDTDIGAHDLRAATLTADGLTATRVVFAGTDGVLSDDSDMTFATDTLTVTKLGAFEAAGAINFASQNMTNVDIDSGTIDGVSNVNSTGTITGSAVYGTTIGQNRTDGLKTITIEANSTVNQDLTTDAAPTFAGLTSTSDIVLTGQATDIDLIDNTATALTFDAGAGGLSVLTIDTSNSAERIVINGDVSASGDFRSISTSTGSFGHLEVNTISGSGTILAAAALTLSETPLDVTSGGTGTETLANKAVLISQDSGTDTIGTAVMDANGELIIGGTAGPSVMAASTLAGTGIDATTGDGTVALSTSAAQTTITSIYATDLIMGEDNQTNIDFGTVNQISFNTNNAEDFRMVAGGTFHANADVVAFSSTIASDMNLKENITDMKYGLDDVMKLRGVEYDWKREDMGHDVGVLAQEVEAVIPELVKEYDGLRGKFKAVDYNKLVPILIESIKELKTEVDSLRVLTEIEEIKE